MSRHLKIVLTAFLAGVLGLGGAWAGVGLSPLRPTDHRAQSSAPGIPGPRIDAREAETTPHEVAELAGTQVTLPEGRLDDGWFLVGANRTSIEPAPELFGGTEWQRENCFELEQANPDHDHALPSEGHGWPFSTPDCIYLGGFGIGPARAAQGMDPGGVWVRSVAISNGEQTLVHQIVDSVGYFYRYQGGVCEDCGLHDIRQAISADTGIPEDNLLLASTHSHSGPDNYGGWGGVPPWYWSQMRDSMKASAKAALLNLSEATIDVGAVTAREMNNERRDTYFSNSDTEIVWLQARDAQGAVVATLANFAGHPTIVNTPRPRTATWDADSATCTFVEGPGTPVLHADWPGAAAREFEARFGGTGLLFEGGLGNVSISGRSLPTPECDATVDEPVGSTHSTADLSARGTGRAFAQIVEADIAHTPNRLVSNDVRANVRIISHPVMTNQGLAALGSLGLFSREFIPGTPGADGPGVYRWSKRPNPDHPEHARGCTTASQIQIRTTAGAHRIGEFGVAFGPGELFSNITEVVKEKRRNNVAMATYSQANDALGYILQSFEFDTLGGGAAGEYATQHGEYEEVFALDHCFGDHVLQTMLDTTGELGL